MADDAKVNVKTATAKAGAGPEDVAEERRAYAVLRPVKYDGKLYLPAVDGSIRVSLTEIEAAEMKALGAVGDAPAKAPEGAS